VAQLKGGLLLARIVLPRFFDIIFFLSLWIILWILLDVALQYQINVFVCLWLGLSHLVARFFA
jgi:hypothetical protein